MKVKINKIKNNPFNERKHIEEIAPLIDQMKQRGFIGSLLAREKNGYYEVAFGSRRLDAAKKAGIKEIDLIVDDLDDEDMMVLTTAENATQESVEPTERGKNLNRIQKQTGWSVRDIAKKTGMSKTSVQELLDLSGLSYIVQKKVENKEIGWKTAVDASKIGGEKMVLRAVEQELTQGEVQEIARAIKSNPEKKKELISGKLHPQDLRTASLKKKHMSMRELANKIEREIDQFGQLIDMIDEYWAELPDFERGLIKMSYKTFLKKRLPKLEKLMK